MLMSNAMRRATRFTEEELESMRQWDAEVGASEMTAEDFESEDFVEDLLFPEQAKIREQKKQSRAEKYAAKTEEQRQADRDRIARYYVENKEAVAERHRRWYQENKERIKAHQRDYRIRSGRQMTPEQKAAKKAATAERAKARRIEKAKMKREEKLACA